MVTRRRANSTSRGNAAPAKATPARRAPAKRAPAKRAAAAAAAAKATPAKASKDVTQYAEKEPTEYHKAFARWIVNEVGYDPNSAASKKAAFLAGVSIATAARPAFMDSEYLEEWREKTGTAKRGPKPKEDAETARRKTRQVVSDDEFEDDDEDSDDDEEFEDDDEEFADDDSDEDESDEEFDDEDDDEEFEDDDEEFEDDDEEEAPPARTRRTPAKHAPVKKAAPAKRTRAAKDDFLF